MPRLCVSFLLALIAAAALYADDVVFKSDVALTRVDAQVIDRNNRPITGLQKSDFAVKVDGHNQSIQNFASENMPIDIVLLLDVSGSMEPHVQRIASAAHQALRVLADHDRVAVMVFDNTARTRLALTDNLDDVASELNRTLHAEHFDGGTRITSAMISAATYLRRHARPEARRAVVILTDDETQDGEDEPRVEGALAEANAVLSFLQAPYEVPMRGGPMPGRRRGTWGGGGGGWPGGGWPGGSGPIGMPGGGGPLGGDPSHTAGTSVIAEDTGGDTMQVTDASALEDTLARLRQRYALHFSLPEGSQVGDRQKVRVELSQEARMRYPDAEVRYRRVFISGERNGQAGPTLTTRAPAPVESDTRSVSDSPVSTEPALKQRGAVNEDSGPVINTVDPGEGANTDKSSPSPAKQPAKQTPAPPAQSGGWPRVSGPPPNL